jgi:hypothetical protein
MGYAAVDIISVVFRVAKSYEMPEFLKLEYIKVGSTTPRAFLAPPPHRSPATMTVGRRLGEPT